MNRQERRAAARESRKSKGRADSTTPVAALFESGFVHMRAGQFRDAEVCCRQAIALDANHADSLHLMGLLSQQVKRYDHAHQWISRAIRQDPKPVYFLSLGIAFLSQGDHNEALKAFDKALELGLDDPSLWLSHGQTLVKLERPGDALISFQHALKLSPQYWEAANQCGILLHQLGRTEESLSYINICNQLRPNHLPTLQQRAALLHGLKRFEDALAICRDAYELDPDNANICNNLGIALRFLKEDEESLQWFDRALELQSNFGDALHNKAVALTKMHKFEEAFAIYDRLKASDPNDVMADLGIAHLHLLMGDFEAGWTGREVRWKSSTLGGDYAKVQQPIWLGNESLEGKTILIAADEGLGDTIQFVRYVPMVARLGAQIILVVQDALHSLLSRFSGIAQCIPLSASSHLPAFDFHCPIMSLPLSLKTRLESIPSAISYLPNPPRARVRAWKERLGPHHKFRVGLVWSGNPEHLDDYNRSIPLRTLSSVLDVSATFVSLQKDPGSDDRKAMQERPGLLDFSDDLTDFVETAALIKCLDLVVAVDTSVAHLAASLGRPTWVLLPYTPDYRWLLDRDDSPWYPTMRLFRQTSSRDWREVLDQVRSELRLRTFLFEGFQASAAFENPFR